MLKPCHSPYCECTRDQCTHPGYYDARHLPTKPMTIKSTHQIAYAYSMALIQQRAGEAQLNTALQALGSDNQVFGLAEPIEAAYTALVAGLLGDTLFEWLMWWMYETEMGKVNMEFIIDGVSYDPTTMTLYRFLELVDAS